VALGLGYLGLRLPHSRIASCEPSAILSHDVFGASSHRHSTFRHLFAELPATMADDTKLTSSELGPEMHADSSSLLKPGGRPDDSLNVSRGAIRAPSPDASPLSINDDMRLGPHTFHVPDYTHASRSPAPPRTLRGRLQTFWVKNKGLALVLIAQFFGTLMNVTTRILEIEGNHG
jgi:hypothetical protein